MQERNTLVVRDILSLPEGEKGRGKRDYLEMEAIDHSLALCFPSPAIWAMVFSEQIFANTQIMQEAAVMSKGSLVLHLL